MLDSKPTDNVSQIESNYIELKKTYNDRHCTIPNVDDE